MQFILAVLAKLIQLLLPVLLEKVQDTAEEGSGENISHWRETVRSSGWSDEAIAATNPKEL